MNERHDTHDMTVLINTKTGQPEDVLCSCGAKWKLVQEEGK